MTFGAPVWLALGALGAAVVVALHFLARQRPRAVDFPTARFIPERVARAPSRALKPSDLLLLALRAMALIFLGAAFARPAWSPSRSGTVRIVAVDRSRAVGNVAEARDSAMALLGARDRVVLFDSTAQVVSARDSIVGLTITRAAGSLSAALVAAERAGVAVARTADSVELVIVSPFAREEWDAATEAIRTLWPGRVRLVRVAMAAADTIRVTPEFRGAADDPLRTGGFGARPVAQAVRIVSGESAPADSVWAAEQGGVLVRWPARIAGAPTDTAGAVVLGDDVVVAPFARRPSPPTAAARVSARWADGAPAATQHAAGARGCIRDVTIPVPTAGDLVLRESFRRLVAGLLAPCDGVRDGRSLGDSTLAQLRGAGALAAGAKIDSPVDAVTPLSRWLLAAAALLLVAEPLLRRRAA